MKVCKDNDFGKNIIFPYLFQYVNSISIWHSDIQNHDIRIKFPDGFRVYTTDPAAKYVAYGTQPHIITPARGMRLRFFWETQGRWVSLPWVFHPGQRKNPFHARTYRLAYAKARELAQSIPRSEIRT